MWKIKVLTICALGGAKMWSNKKAPVLKELFRFRSDYKGNQSDLSMCSLYQLIKLCQLHSSRLNSFAHQIVWWTAGESNPKLRNDKSEVTAESRPTQEIDTMPGVVMEWRRV